MPGVAENAIELPNAVALHEDQTILANLETTAICRFSGTCGPRCLLNQLNSGAGRALSQREVLELAGEFLSSSASRHIRHFCALGKEVMEAPETLFEISRRWHALPESVRPGTIGIITSNAAALKRHVRDFADHPFSWIVISLDAPSTGLRTGSNETPLLDGAVAVRNAGGTSALGVNTLLTPGNLSEVLALGQRIRHARVSQWSVGSFLAPAGNELKPTVGGDGFRRAIDAVVSEFADSEMRILFDLGYRELVTLVGDERRLTPSGDSWRYEYQVTNGITLAALSERPNRFLRARMDGELLSKADFKMIGLEKGTYGRWQPGRVSEILSEFVASRNEAHQPEPV